MEKQVGRKLGKYEVVAELGEGGMGVVYKARDIIIGRMVAIKTISPDLVSDPEILKRFYREAQSAGTLQHPNIVTIHDMGESDGCPYIVMEYVEGDSLKNIITRKQAIPLATKLKLIQQFCEGLSHAHKNGFVHRDVKPANILLTKAGIVKVVDFGIVHLDTTTLTKTGTFLGTIHYASPEQVNDGHVDSRSDLWSVACVIYELISYKKPFDGSTVTAVIAKILNSEPVPLSKSAPDAPPEFDAVLSKALKKNPAERYQSLDELLADILPLSQELQLNYIGDLLVKASDLRTKGDLDAAQDRVREALYLDNTHAGAKKLQSEITSDIQRLPPEVKARKLVSEAEQAFGRGEFAAVAQALGEAQKLVSLDDKAKAMLDKATREQKRANEQREAIITGTRKSKALDPSLLPETTSIQGGSPLAVPSAQPKAATPNVAHPAPAQARKGGSPAPRVVPAPKGGQKSSFAWVAALLLVAASAAGGYFYLRPKLVKGPSIEETRLEAEAQGLQEAGDLQAALAKWQELAAKNGALKDEATVAAGVVSQKLNQEKGLYDQARAAEEQKQWDNAIADYKKVVALNGPLKDQANEAIRIDMELQRGVDATQIEQQMYDQADSAMKRFDYEGARGFFKDVINLKVPNSALAAKSEAALAQIDQLISFKQAFDAADRAEANGDLKGAQDQFQKIADGSGPMAAQAKARVARLNDKISNVAAQQAFNSAVQAETRGDLNGALGQFKSIASSPGAFQEDAKTHVQQITDKLNAAAAKQQFEAADRTQSSGDLKGALAQFKTLADGSGPMKAQAEARVQQINDTLAAASKPKPGPPKPVVTQPVTPQPVARIPTVTPIPGGDPQRSTLSWHKGLIVPDYTVDGGLQPTNLTMPPVPGAPAGSMVLIKISVDENGNVTPNQVVNDTSGFGSEVQKASRSWKFKPPLANGKPVSSSISVRVSF